MYFKSDAQEIDIRPHSSKQIVNEMKVWLNKGEDPHITFTESCCDKRKRLWLQCEAI